jgi:cobalt/nickel transport system permease protein
MINIDKYAYASRLNRIDPLQKFVFALGTLGVCLWANTVLISIAVFVIMGWVTIRKGGTPLSVFFKMMLVPMAFLLIGVLTIVINISSTPEVFLLSMPIAGFWIGFSKLGMVQAGQLFFRVLGSVSCLYFLSLSTPMVSILSVLRRLKVPQLMIEMMSLVYRFIFVLLDTATTMFTAQNSRLGYNNWVTGYRSLGTLASTLFIRAYKRANDLFIALEARGYDGNLQVIEEPSEKSFKLYILAIAVNVSLIMLALSLKL